MFSYTIPDEIKAKIPGQFMKELVLQIGLVFQELSVDEFNFIAGTCGWNDAFTAACSECGCEWLAEYAAFLDWYEWDMFTGELTDTALESWRREQ